MCDQKQLEKWAKEGLTRRQFGAASAMAAVAACAPTSGEAGNETSVPDALTERQVTFETADGTMDAVLIAPSSGKHPGVIFWPDIASIREAKLAMARQVAKSGRTVLLLNPYYRDVAGQQFADFADFAGNGGFQKVGPWREKLTAEAIMRDAKSATGFLDAQDSVDTSRPIGTQGYCMGGPFTFWTAAAVPGRVKAVASFHGGGLVRDGDPLSPHNTFDDTQASYLIAIAQNDDAKAPGDKTALREAADAAGRPAEIEVYAADHGWTVPDSPAYDQAEAARAWDALMKLYKANL